VPQKAREVKAALLKKGFKPEQSKPGQKKKNRDHEYFFFYLQDKKTNIFTKISHGETEIHDQNCSHMARQIRLNNSQFKDFVDCPLDGPGYLRILVQGRHVEQPPKG